MKKYIGAICSALAGILTFIMLSLNWVATKTSTALFGSTKTTNGGYTGWELISNKTGDVEQAFSDINGYGLFRTFAIIMLVLAIVLTLMAVVLFLQKFKILKIKVNLNILNCFLLVFFLISIIVAIIGAGIISKNISNGLDFVVISGNTKANIGVGAWILLAVGVVSCFASCALARKQK